VSLATPHALWALLLVPLLVWLERQRRRPRTRTWPSLLLWRAIAEETAERKRRFDPLLLCECGAVVLCTLAAAEPSLAGGARARTVVVLHDRGPHMQALLADGRTAAAATRAEIERLTAVLGADDRVVEGDLPRGGAARGDEDLLVVATYKGDHEGEGILVVGRAPRQENAGIDAVGVNGDRVWYTMRDETGKTTEHRVAWQTSIGARRTDACPSDDVITLRRVPLTARDETGSARVKTALLRSGTSATPGAGSVDLVVTNSGGEVVPGIIRGADCEVLGDLFADLWLGDIVWRGARSRVVASGALLAHQGRVLAAWLDERTLWLGVPLDAAWDEHGTLALLVERAKRARRAARLEPGETLVGDAAARPAPGWIDVRGEDRPWDGTLPEAKASGAGATALRAGLALAAILVLLVYVRALRR